MSPLLRLIYLTSRPPQERRNVKAVLAGAVTGGVLFGLSTLLVSAPYSVQNFAITTLVNAGVGLARSLITSALALLVVRLIVIKRQINVVFPMAAGAVLPLINTGNGLIGHSPLYTLIGAVTGMVVWLIATRPQEA